MSALQFEPLKSRPLVLRELERCLLAPLDDLLARPKKEVRGSLVQLGFDLVTPNENTADASTLNAGIEACALAVEALHTGSLIVDDIEDASEWRRGGPTLHLKYGLPTALNAGNWLYFYAFQRVRQSSLPPEIRLKIYELIEEVLLEAHTGQALDVGIDISKIAVAQIPEFCCSSLELKSGALMSLALQMGAVIAGAGNERLQAIRDFGIQFGVSLQMFDDLGNVRVDKPTGKHLEDLVLRRPSFVWWCLAEHFPTELPHFIEALSSLPEASPLRDFLAKVPLLETGFSRALAYQQKALRKLENEIAPTPIVFNKIRAIAERVANAYS